MVVVLADEGHRMGLASWAVVLGHLLSLMLWNWSSVSWGSSYLYAFPMGQSVDF